MAALSLIVNSHLKRVDTTTVDMNADRLLLMADGKFALSENGNFIHILDRFLSKIQTVDMSVLLGTGEMTAIAVNRQGTIIAGVSG